MSCKTAHYSAKVYNFLSSELTARKMYDLFLIKRPYVDSNIKYEFYLKYISENFNLKLGRSQIDTCAFCEEWEVKFKSPQINENAKCVASRCRIDGAPKACKTVS